ncbi:MAG: metallophosphoesterase family protein [Solirubrobacterales bacterium]|nr:metallophosphoesterase family protein [Solirubrobacterales bacterium]
MQIALISDTHMPKGTRRLPEACIERLKAADLIVHAGDLSRVSVLEELRAYSPVIAVRGNVDDTEVRNALPETAQFDASGATIAVIHDAGPAAGRLERLKRRFPSADAVVFGHSHQPAHQEDRRGFQIFNPGSPTERRRAPWPSMGLARATNGRLSFELIKLG